MKTFGLGLLALAALAAAPGSASAQDVSCPVRLGSIIPLTGPQGPIGKPIADTAQLAVEHINEAGGIKGCPVELILRDDTGQPTVGLDAARYLVDVQKVPAIVGVVGSGIALPIVSSVTTAAKVPMVSCCAVTPTLTKMAEKGETDGYFFRTIPTSRVMGVAHAVAATDRGYKKVAVIYVNNDFGLTLTDDFKKAFEAMGGEVLGTFAYNENQPSYRAEVQEAMALEPDALVLLALSQDGATIAREWISLGGTQNLVLHNTLRSQDFIDAIGPRYLANAAGIDNAQVEGASVDAFNAAYEAKFGKPPVGPGLHTVYDSVVVTALAMEAADTIDGTAIRDNLRVVTSADGEVVVPGPEGLKKALELLKEGKTIRYTGATGPFQFDKNGDVSGPALIWEIKDGALVTQKVITLEEMDALFKEIGF
ncbi:ABC transporter substrate-binding protein [Acuticoccus kandeliae]|uniref:ABC transporter substrate-binding protein n=1 Tax=Acuticoccus kandeliae TaxID=2073160 RepID=UPI000D3EB559|nr:ABC transporter substrate-binding protein [Acuticoccus kandeliae]